MGKVIHFNSTRERLDFIRGKHTEIIPKEVTPKEEKPKAKKKSKPRKKKVEKNNEVQAD